VDSPKLEKTIGMSVEIEKKYRLSPKQIIFVADTLKEDGAEFVGEDFEENTIYGGGILDETNAVLRIRKTQNRTILTFKKRIQNDFDIKQQIEHESEFIDVEELGEIVSNLGFEPRLIYEKRRRTWRFRTVEIVLDELPFGLYMEIEGPITGIKEAEVILGLEDFETEPETYPRLTARLGSKVGSLIESRFELSK
jgi:adenylate cyclase class 2